MILKPDQPQVPTIKDVATLADVSISTASKALHGLGAMRPETRARVREAALQLGFRPNESAQNLHRKRTYSVGLISSDNYGRFTLPIVEGIEHALTQNQVSVLLCSAGESQEAEEMHLETLLSKRVDGIIITARRIDMRPNLDLSRTGVPYLYVFAQGRSAEEPCLLPDEFGGAKLAVNHLLSLGHRRIAHVTGPESFEAVRARCDGYRSALREAKLSPITSDYLPGSWSEAWGHEAVVRLFANGGGPDAIFCGSDQIARGVTDALRERGVPVPQGVAVVGFDNWEVISAANRPPLTTIDMNLKELGRQSGLQLLEAIEGKVQTGTRHIPCSLVIRQSCGATAASATAPAEVARQSA